MRQTAMVFMMSRLIYSFDDLKKKNVCKSNEILNYLSVILFRFDCGSGTGKVRSDTEVMLNQWNTLTVYRYRWDAWIQLNNGQRVQGRSKVNLNLNLNMIYWSIRYWMTRNTHLATNAFIDVALYIYMHKLWHCEMKMHLIDLKMLEYWSLL